MEWGSVSANLGSPVIVKIHPDDGLNSEHTAPMRCRNQAVANPEELVHLDVRRAVVARRPIGSSVTAGKNSHFGSEIQVTAVMGINHDGENGGLRQIAGEI